MAIDMVKDKTRIFREMRRINDPTDHEAEDMVDQEDRSESIADDSIDTPPDQLVGDGNAAQTHSPVVAAVEARMAKLVLAGKSDVDLSPMRHVADAFLLGRRLTVEAFNE